MFITIDGPDGAGKTTIAQTVTERLRATCNTIYTCEPTDSELGQKIRRILKDGKEEEFSMLKELFLEDRAEHIEKFIVPKINDNLIICDRYKYSTICYQHLQGCSIEDLIDLNKNFLVPNISFILYSENENVLLNRIAKRNNEKDLFETQEFLKKANNIYKNMAHYFPNENIVLMNAEQDFECIVESIICKIKEIKF